MGRRNDVKRPGKSELLRLQKEFRTDQAVADQYGVSRQAVFQWRKHHGIRSMRVNNGARDYEIRRLNATGRWPVPRLAAKFDLSLSHVYLILQKK